MSDEEGRAQAFIAPYREEISNTPALLSLLYDANLLPEQITSIRSARALLAVMFAYRIGLVAGSDRVRRQDAD